MKQIIWNNKYLYNPHIIPNSHYGLLLEETDDSNILVYGICILNKNLEWYDLKEMSKIIEDRYKENEQFKYFIDTF